MLDIYRKALELSAENSPVVLSSIIYTIGSAPQKAGIKAVMGEDGNLWGTIGGGLVEADALEKMRRMVTDGDPELYEFRLDEEYTPTAGPICGGVMRLYTQRCTSDHLSAIESAVSAYDSNERGVMVSYLSGPQAEKVHWLAEKSIDEGNEFPSQDDLKNCLSREKPCTIVGEDGAEVYIEPLIQTPRLLIIGGGHVGQAIALQAELAGFEITVFDDREEFAQPELFPPDTALAHGNMAELVSGYPKGPDCYIVIVSKGHIMDSVALGACIHDDVRFLGLIGSKRKVHSLRKYFLDEGRATQEEWNRILSPIGYEIGAESVAEIGFSIVPQLIAARRLPSAVRNINSMSLSS